MKLLLLLLFALPLQAQSTLWNVKYYGAKGNGVQDDTAFIQKAINARDNAGGGTVYAPCGDYPISSTIVVALGSTQNYVNFLGEGPNCTQLTWIGPSDVPAFVCSNCKYIFLKGFRLKNLGSQGTTTGLILTGTGTGTQTTGSILESIIIDGFNTCLDTGGGNHTSSEMLYTQITLQNCVVGAWLHDFNAISHNFRGLNLNNVDWGIDATTSNVYIDGGSATNVGTLLFSANSGPIVLSNYYAENTRDAFLSVNIGSSIQPVTLSGVNLKMATPGVPSIHVNGTTQLTITGSTINGTIHAGSSSLVTIIGSGVFSQLPTDPIVFGQAGIVSLHNFRRDGNNVRTGVFPNAF